MSNEDEANPDLQRYCRGRPYLKIRLNAASGADFE
jgi:hypothetical protein